MNTQQRDFIVDKIVSSINDDQVTDSYEFDGVDITWVPAQEQYQVSHRDGWEWASPSDIKWYIEDLSDDALEEWFIDEYCCEDWFLECVDELMLEETE